MRDDWCRRSTWTDDDRQEFDARLKRRRGPKAQYLCIQASYLAKAGLHTAAIELLDRLLTEFPERIELATAHLHKAEIFSALGENELAITEYRAALQAERDFPNVRTNAWLDFGWFVVEKQLSGLYGEVLEVFEEFRDRSELTFPALEYRYWAVRAIIADSRGDRMGARDFAEQALAQAAKEHSGLRYHAKLGLVGAQPQWMEKKLRALAGG
jgi:tetratricopeptide (TPR) repeat protein